MPSRRDRVRLDHMLDHAREAITLTRGKTRADLDSDRLLSLALVRLLEIVGEAAGRVTKRNASYILKSPGLRSSAYAIGSFTDMMRWIMTFFGRSLLTTCLLS